MGFHVAIHDGPAAGAGGPPLASPCAPTPLAEAESARLSPPPIDDSRPRPGPPGFGLPVRRWTRRRLVAPPHPRPPPSGTPASDGAVPGSPRSVWVRAVTATPAAGRRWWRGGRILFCQCPQPTVDRRLRQRKTPARTISSVESVFDHADEATFTMTRAASLTPPASLSSAAQRSAA